MGRRYRLGFVTPRFGPEVVGGSEAVMAEAARALAGRGHRVELLTTCARSHVSWDNEYAPGAFAEDGVEVHRFPAVTGGARLVVAKLERRVQRGERLRVDEELAWLNGRLRVPELYFHLLANAAHLDAVVLSPYLFWTTIYGAAAAPTRAIVVPCLHDEPYARLAVVAATLGAAAGAWFLSEPEHELAQRLMPKLPAHQRVVGAAVEEPGSYDPAAFRARHRLSRPFVLFAGRREEGKGWRTLLSDFAALVATDDPGIDLVTVGSGAARVPGALASRVVDLGFIGADELASAFAAALALVQPSANESFSRTVMESFLARTPVVATASGDVVAWHLARSGGGIVYRDPAEFTAAIGRLAREPGTAADLGARGRAYVLANYTWERVADAMEEALAAFAARGR